MKFLYLFIRLAFNRLFGLTFGESLVQLSHNPRPPFGLSVQVPRSAHRSLKSASLVIRK